MKCCKDCKHSIDNDQVYSPIGFAMMPLLGVPIPGVGVKDLKCNNYKSVYYGDGVDDYDDCYNFEEK
jgi:hypothetical protein